MPRGTLEVVEYVPRLATKDAVPPDQPRRSEDLWSRLRLEHRTLTSCAAALTAVGLHLLFVAPVLWGEVSRHSQERAYRGDAALQWVTLVDSTAMHAIRPRLPGPPALMSIAVTAESKLPARSLPAGSSAARGDPAADPAADQAGFGAMYGRYVGQIRARIDRAWQRPRTAIGAEVGEGVGGALVGAFELIHPIHLGIYVGAYALIPGGLVGAAATAPICP